MPRVPAMSRQAQQAYGFSPQAQAHGYYYDDTEGYVGDYSESDALSDGPAPIEAPLRVIQRAGDVTELYRRKNAGAGYQNVYMPAEYYYEPQQVRVATAQPVYRKRIVMHPQYSPPPPQGVYHPSLPHVAAVPRALPRTPSASAVRQQIGGQPQIIRRHPVTVRTPRYVRRSAAAPVYKRPSTLCLPIACQPDPATCRRVRRVIPGEVLQQEIYPAPSRVIRRQSYSAPNPLPATKAPLVKKESKKSLDVTKTRLDAILERYEKIFGKTPEPKPTADSGDQEIIKHLKPREPQVPQIENITKDEIPGIMQTAETFEVEEITSEVLDELLSELNEHGFNDVIDEEDRRKVFESKAKRQAATPENKIIAEKCENELTAVPKECLSELPVKDLPKSYNYQEIKDSLSKSNNGGFGSEIEEVTSQKSLKRIERPQSQKVTTMPKLNAADALELHRTKSYVVNLIDTALSNHFGTNLSEKNANSKECMDARSAVEMLKRQSSSKMDKDLCHEIAQVLTDSLTSNSTGTELNKGSQCSCKSQIPDEPSFVKQLKQMRWGHLKHIQREVRRLEDLERFLDSCSTATCDKYQSP